MTESLKEIAGNGSNSLGDARFFAQIWLQRNCNGRRKTEMETMATLLKGRAPLRCSCGEELFVEEIETDDGQRARFIPCRCGSEELIFVPEGSIVGSLSPTGPYHVWGPALL